jgi:hypothetical protein
MVCSVVQATAPPDAPEPPLSTLRPPLPGPGTSSGREDADDARHLLDGQIGRLADLEEARVLVA